MLLKNKAMRCHAKCTLALKGFKITAFQGSPVFKISIPHPSVFFPTPMAAFSLSILLSRNLFSCCKVSFGNLCLTVHLHLPTSTKWARRHACRTMSLKHLGKREPSEGCGFFFGGGDECLRVIFNEGYLADFTKSPLSKNQVMEQYLPLLPKMKAAALPYSFTP